MKNNTNGNNHEMNLDEPTGSLPRYYRIPKIEDPQDRNYDMNTQKISLKLLKWERLQSNYFANKFIIGSGELIRQSIILVSFFTICKWIIADWLIIQARHFWGQRKTVEKEKCVVVEVFPNFSWMFLNPNNIFRFEF